MTRVVMFKSGNAFTDPRIAKEADALTRAGYEVIVLAWDRTGVGGEAEPGRGWHVEHLGPRAAHGGGVRNIGGFRAFWREAGERAVALDADVLHCHDLDTAPAALRAMKRAAPKAPRLVLDFWELYRESRMLPQHGLIGSLARGAARVLERRSIPRADFVITVTEGQVDYYRSLGAKRVVLVENAPVLGNYAPVERNKPEFVVSFIGRMRYVPALATLMRAVQPHPELGVLLVGGGPSADEIARLAGGLERIEVRGAVENCEVAALYRSCDAVYACYDISLGNWRTAFPVKVMEGMACGLPVIVTRGSWIAEYAEREGFGVAVDHDDVADVERAIVALATNRMTAHEMGRRGRRIVEQELNWDAAAARLICAYAEMLGKSG